MEIVVSKEQARRLANARDKFWKNVFAEREKEPAESDRRTAAASQKASSQGPDDTSRDGEAT
jgi:hypothetical protein